MACSTPTQGAARSCWPKPGADGAHEETPVATWWRPCGSGVLADDPQAAIRSLPDLVEQARSTGQRLVLVQQGRNLLGHLATIGRYDAVAVLDGASPPTSMRPPWRPKP